MYNSYPNRSPLGNRQAVIPAHYVFQSDEDYIFPLNLNEQGGELVKQSDDNNLYFVGIYIRETHIERVMKVLDESELGQWISRWKIRNHPYLRLEPNHHIQYLATTGKMPIWYQILVPYEIQLPEGETAWKAVNDTGRWQTRWGREVTYDATFFLMGILLANNIYDEIH